MTIDANLELFDARGGPLVWAGISLVGVLVLALVQFLTGDSPFGLARRDA